MPAPQLYWLLDPPNWAEVLRSLDVAHGDIWPHLVGQAQHRLDFVKTARLDKFLQTKFGQAPPSGLQSKPVRLAVLGSATVEHLIAGIRIGALRRNLWCSIYIGPYGQYRQEILDPHSALCTFSPTHLLLSLDARHALGRIPYTADIRVLDDIIDRKVEDLRDLWRNVRDLLGCSIIQQTILPVYSTLVGNNEHRLATAPRRLIDRFNQRLRDVAVDENVDLLSLDARIIEDGMSAWYDPVLWYRAKQEIALQATPFYGDLVARLIAARQGLSSKCLCLDLDNTLWGGVIGDDGLNGIVLGPGSTLGEAYVAFQEYVQQLARRGVIVAVCSKNDHSTAMEAFESHPEMILRPNDIAAFVANWSDKPTNLRRIADQLNIGIDSIVFVDDNLFERNIVRRELPMVAVPEVPEDPALFARCLSDAGYFEAAELTSEDFVRTVLYQEKAKRETMLASTSDIGAYLKSLEMKLSWGTIDKRSMGRAVQLINKTNQFNLTTRRYSESDILAVQADSRTITLQLRLVDNLGDNGIICVVVAKPSIGQDSIIDTWLMSCRVLGRGVEQATLNLLVDQARRKGFKRLIGEYRETAKNHMVKEHFSSLGFQQMETGTEGNSLWSLEIEAFSPFPTHIELVEND